MGRFVLSTHDTPIALCLSIALTLCLSRYNLPPMLTASEMGRKGGKARAANMTAKERSEHMRRASQAFWAKLTPEERSALARKRARVRKKRRRHKNRG